MKPRKNTVRKLYREGLLQVFGCGDNNIDKYLIAALKSDVHYGDEAPGGWTNDSILEIYCENGIPNATDMNDFSYEAREFGLDPSQAVSYNCDKWETVDKYVNLGLRALGFSDQVYHEPYNSAVVSVSWS
jgi:hypothetical protein